MDPGLALVLGVASWAALVGALALQRAQARSVIARYPADVQARPDFRERYGSTNQPFSARKHFLSLARAGWSVFFVAFFFVFGLADFGLVIELTTAALLGVIFAGFSYPEVRREEDDYSHKLGVKVEASRLERARIAMTYRLLAYGQSILWLVGTAFLGYGLAAIIA